MDPGCGVGQPFQCRAGLAGACMSIGYTSGPGYRIYFGRHGDTLIILLGGGTKDRQQRDIERRSGRFGESTESAGVGRDRIWNVWNRSVMGIVYREEAQAGREFREGLAGRYGGFDAVRRVPDVGLILLHHYIYATMGFEKMGELIGKSPDDFVRRCCCRRMATRPPVRCSR